MCVGGRLFLSQVQGFEAARSKFGRVMKYTGMVDCLVTVITREGVLALYKGATPTLLKVGCPRLGMCSLVRHHMLYTIAMTTVPLPPGYCYRSGIIPCLRYNNGPTDAASFKAVICDKVDDQGQIGRTTALSPLFFHQLALPSLPSLFCQQSV